MEFTPARLSRWSVVSGPPLPSRETIKSIFVYDFDNTLFMSPLPNPKVWQGPTIGHLMGQDYLKNGGWWHDSRVLAATGQGVDVEEGRSWQGWWNEKVVSLVKLSMQQQDSLSVLLTGRSVGGFASLIKRMVDSRQLVFDIVALRPEKGVDGEHIRSTLDFKCMFFTDLLNTYSAAEEIKVYEDRQRHVTSFEAFFSSYIKNNCRRPVSPRGPLVAQVVHVVEKAMWLDPVAEVREIQKMIDDHNLLLTKPSKALVIRKNVSFTGYLLSPLASVGLLKGLNLADLATQYRDFKLTAAGIMIVPRASDAAVTARAGLLGTKIKFNVIAWGHHEFKVWAALVEPVDPGYQIYSESVQPVIVLGIRRDGKPHDAQKISNWQAIPNGKYQITTIIAEKALLRIEEEAKPQNMNHEAERIAHHQSRRGNYQSRHNTQSRGGNRNAKGKGQQGQGRGGANAPIRRVYNNSVQDRDRDRDRDRERERERYQHLTSRPAEPADVQYLSEMMYD